MAVVTLSSLDRILARTRFQMHAALGLQAIFLAIAVLAGFVSPIGVQVGELDAGAFLVIVTGMAWFLVVMRSLKQQQLMRQAALLISQGHAAQAVPFLSEMLQQFSVFRLGKIVALQHLMAMAYEQKDYSIAARLADEILRYELARRKGLACRACLVRADSLMELGDADGAGEVLARLHGQKLTVSQQLQLLPILLRWQMISGQYVQATDRLEQKVQMATLLNAEKACLVHVLLAAAAGYRGQRDASRFLLRRAGLHYNLRALAQDNPSAASYLVQLQAADHEAVVSAGGRKAHGHAAGSAVIDDVQATAATETLDDHVCPDDSDCDLCSGPQP